jgi:hypothetical protein
MLNEVQSIIASPYFGVFSGVLGFFLGHRFSIGRDKRKEFNDCADPLFRQLEQERISPSPFKHPTATDFALLRRHLGRGERKNFDRAVTAYFKAKQASVARDSAGGVYYQNTSDIVAAVCNLLSFTTRR